MAVFTGWKRSLMYFSCGFVKFKGDQKDKREIHNGNWTEWSAIWSEIIREISKSNESAPIWIHKYDFRPKLYDLKFNCHFVRSILKSHNLISKFAKLWLFCLSFSYNVIALKSDWLFCFTVPFSLAEKKMRFRAKK